MCLKGEIQEVESPEERHPGLCRGCGGGGELSEGSFHSGRNSPWHYCRAETAQVSDTLREGRGKEERVGKALHDINNCMWCTSVPTGLCVMSLSCRCVSMGSISRAPTTEQYAERE